jgi:hypothetical protein
VALKDLFALAREPDGSGGVWESWGKAVVFQSGQSDTMFYLPAELDPRPIPLSSLVKDL